MRAAVFHDAGTPLAIEHVPDPEPAPGKVLIEVSHCGICGSDLHMTESAGLIQPGTILGHEFAGVVVDGGTSRIAAGSRVTAIPLFPCWTCEECEGGHLMHCARKQLIGADASGGYAEALAIDARLVQPLPDGVSFEDGALIEPLAVGRRMVSLAEGLKGARVLILGGGPVGIAGVVFARLAGAATIIVSEINALRRDKAMELGADRTIDPAGKDTSSRAAILCGGPPDIVFECVGRPGMFAEAIRAVKPRGQIVSAGASFQHDGFAPIEAVVKEVTMRFSAGYSVADFAAIADALARRDIEAERLVTQVVSLNDLPSTFENLRRPNGHCKVMVDIRR